jgi:transcription elongation factor GreA
MNGGNQNPGLGEAAGSFLASLSPEERGTNQQEIYKFVRWYGWERPLVGLTAPEVANYAERLSLSDTDYVRKLDLVRTFLVYAKKEGWSRDNLATHLKAKKRAPVRPAPKRRSPQSVSMTREGYAKLEAELIVLKDRRSQAIDEMRRAAADKDFRENAPLDAAREQRQHLEGRIIEMEETIKSAVIVDNKPEVNTRVSVGSSVILRDLASGEELRYTLVGPREVDPTKGKVSSVSPIGKAITGRSAGDTVEITVPAGKLRYQIKRVGN